MEKLTNDQLLMSVQTMCEGSFKRIGSLELPSGLMPCDKPDGLTTDLFGQALVPASHSVPPVKAAGSTTTATCGHHGSASSASAALSLCLGSKSPALLLLERLCKICGEQKPNAAFRVHNNGGFRLTCRCCENLAVRKAKPWRSDRKRAYMRLRRNKMRGFALCNDARRRAKERGLAFELTPQDIQQRIENGVCEVTGFAFDLTKPKGWNAPSLDQIRAGAGYTNENTRVVIYALNVMANEWGLNRVRQIAAALMEE